MSTSLLCCEYKQLFFFFNVTARHTLYTVCHYQIKKSHNCLRIRCLNYDTSFSFKNLYLFEQYFKSVLICNLSGIWFANLAVCILLEDQKPFLKCFNLLLLSLHSIWRQTRSIVSSQYIPKQMPNRFFCLVANQGFQVETTNIQVCLATGSPHGCKSPSCSWMCSIWELSCSGFLLHNPQNVPQKRLLP